MSEESRNNPSADLTMQMVTDIVTAYVSHNPVPANSLSEVIRTVHQSLESLSMEDKQAEREDLKPAVPIKKSITDDHIICLEDGKKLKMLKRYLRTRYDMTPEDYRERWNLPADYPMVAPSYAARRSQFAKDIGLGHSGRGGRKKKI